MTLPGPWHLERKLGEIRSHVERVGHRSFVIEQVGGMEGDRFHERWLISCGHRCPFHVEVTGDEVAGAGRLDLCETRGWAAFLESAKLLPPRGEPEDFWVRLGRDEGDPFL